MLSLKIAACVALFTRNDWNITGPILHVFFSTVCDDNCKEVILDPESELLVCTISGHCFDRLLLPSDAEADAVSFYELNTPPPPFTNIGFIL